MHEGQEQFQFEDVIRHTGIQRRTSERNLAPLFRAWYVYPAEWRLAWLITAAVVIPFGDPGELKNKQTSGVHAHLTPVFYTANVVNSGIGIGVYCIGTYPRSFTCRLRANL